MDETPKVDVNEIEASISAMSKRFSISSPEFIAVLKGLGIALGGAALTYLSSDIAAGLHHLLNLPQPVLHQLLAHLAVQS